MAKKVCDRYCEGCVFSGMVNGGSYRICNYILITGHMRGCDPGKGCAVRKTRREAKRDGK